jgi:FlaG/FlaF family flagellin (archaellin)
MRRHNISLGVSPVIGTVLLVALTVGLVILTSSLVFEVGDNTVSTSPDISVETIQISTEVIETTIIQNENVKELYIINNTGDEIGGQRIRGQISGQRISEVGETYVINSSSDDFSPGESVSIVVIMNYSDIVLTTFETKTG